MSKLPKEINKEQLSKFLRENSKDIKDFVGSAHSGYLIILKEPTTFPDNKRYNKIFVRDYTDFNGDVLISGIKNNKIGNGDSITVKGLEEKKFFNFFDNIEKDIQSDEFINTKLPKQRKEPRENEEYISPSNNNIIHCTCGGHYVNRQRDKKEHEKTQKHRKYFHNH